MLLFSLLARGTEKLEQAKEDILESRFAARGCSKTDMKCRLAEMKRRAEELRRESDERQRRVEEAWKAKENQRCAQNP